MNKKSIEEKLAVYSQPPILKLRKFLFEQEKKIPSLAKEKKLELFPLFFSLA